MRIDKPQFDGAERRCNRLAANPVPATVVPKRRPARSRLYVIACLCSSGGWEQVKLRDLSPSGALVEGANPPAVGSTVQLMRGTTTVNGRVAWIDGTWFGIAFNEPLEPGFLADQLNKQLKVSAPRWYRRGQLVESTIDSE